MKNTSEHPLVILGAGPCGLGAGLRLQKQGFHDFLILEASEVAGGLARSFVDPKGFTWDVGGHVQFSHYEDFDEAMEEALGEEWLQHERQAWVWMHRAWVPYPFQNNLHRLPESLQQSCLRGLESINRPRAPENFGEWIDQSFGSGIADCFMRPYNFKVWAHAPEEMSYQWIGERVAQIDLEKVRKNLKEKKDDVAWGPNSVFRFPKRGGTGSIWASLAQRIPSKNIQFNSRVDRIDLDHKRLILSSGQVIHYGTLLSTVPLHKLSELTSLPIQGSLLYNHSHIVGIGLQGRRPKELESKCWIYFPEHEYPFYRVTVFSNYSPFNVPDSRSHWSLMCETSESAQKPVNSITIVRETVEALRKVGFIDDSQEILSQWHYVAKPGYPVPSLRRDEIVHDFLHRLEAHSIFSRGRFGVWKYEVSNQDHTYMQGLEWVDWYLEGVSEETYRYPSKVNAPGKRPKRPAVW